MGLLCDMVLCILKRRKLGGLNDKCTFSATSIIFFLLLSSFVLFTTLEQIASLTAGCMYIGLWLPVNDLP